MRKENRRPAARTAKTKRRSEEHLIDEEGTSLLKSCLPPEWALRPYKPDYGLDFALEIFARVEARRKSRRLFETLGEHIFIQLKSTESLKERDLKVFSRFNVEKQREQLTDQIATLRVASHRLDSAELATIDRMGVGAPVLLVIADLRAKRCYFVCLNDYIDKILVPRYGDDATAKSRTVDVPLENSFTRSDPTGERALRWYGKRAKLYAAFQRFVFQYSNLENEQDDPTQVVEMARYFVRRIAPYDFWDDTEIWAPVGRFGNAVREYLRSGDALKLRLETGTTEYERTRDTASSIEQQAMDLLRLWKQLALLPTVYEDVCREWFLPTALGYLTRDVPAASEGSFDALYAKPRL